MAVKLSSDTIQEAIGALTTLARSATKQPKNLAPFVVGGRAGTYAYKHKRDEGEAVMPAMTGALLTGGLAGLATNATQHYFAGKAPYLRPRKFQIAPAQQVPHRARRLPPQQLLGLQLQPKHGPPPLQAQPQ